MVDFPKQHIGTHSGSAYQIQRGKVYEVASVNVLQKPWLYRLKHLKSRQVLPGFYYARELSRPDLSRLQKTKILKRETTKHSNMAYAQFSNNGASFERWIPE